MTPIPKTHPQAASRGRPIENDLDLETVAELRFDNQIIGTYILSTNRRRDRLQFVFGFATEGFHSAVDEDSAQRIVQRLQEGLDALPKGERLQLRIAKVTDDSARQAELNALAANTDHDILKLGLFSAKERTRQLNQHGERQHIRLRIFATWTPDTTTLAGQSHIEKALVPIYRFLTRLQPTAGEDESRRIEHLLKRSFSEGYLPWMTLLTARMGLTVRPLAGGELWEAAGQCFSQTTTPPLPQLLVADEHGLHEHIRTRRDPRLILTQAALPMPGEDCIKLHDDSVGVVSLVDKPDGWGSATQQAGFLFAALKQPDVVNTEFVIEVASADRNLQRQSLQLLTRQSNNTANRAAEQNATDVQAAFNADQAVDARLSLIKGVTTVNVAFVALVRRNSRQQLEAACNRFISHFPGAWLERERFVAWQLWRQALPVTTQPLQVHGLFDQRLLFFSNEAAAFLSLLKPRPHDNGGLELIAEDGGVPIHLDIYNSHPLYGMRNTDIYGTTRSGKSVLASSILLRALAEGLLVTTVDYPKPDGTSSFTDFARLLGGMYFDVAKECCNILQIPDLRRFPDDEKQQRLDQFKGSLIPVLMHLVVGEARNDQLPAGKDTIKSVLQLALEEFFNDASIMARYHAAHQSGLGSADWKRIPTLFDLLHFLQEESITLSGSGRQATEALNYCRLKLRSFLHSPGVGKALSRPSTINANASLVVFALTNVTDPQDAAIMALTANIMALSRALAVPASIFFIDESPILMQFEQVSLMMGRIRANGGKAGIRTILAAQDPDTIAHSAAGAQILQNTNTRLVGRVQGAAIASFEQHLNIPRPVIAGNASEGFFPNPHGMYSNWLLEDGGTYTRCRFYPSPILLALTANNPDEQAARTKVMRHFEGRPLEGLATFSKLLTQAIQSGQKLADVIACWQETAV